MPPPGFVSRLIGVERNLFIRVLLENESLPVSGKSFFFRFGFGVGGRSNLSLIGPLYCFIAGLMNVVVLLDALKRRPIDKDEANQGVTT